LTRCVGSALGLCILSRRDQDLGAAGPVSTWGSGTGSPDVPSVRQKFRSSPFLIDAYDQS
jgi:hypothetical protein